MKAGVLRGCSPAAAETIRLVPGRRAAPSSALKDLELLEGRDWGGRVPLWGWLRPLPSNPARSAASHPCACLEWPRLWEALSSLGLASSKPSRVCSAPRGWSSPVSGPLPPSPPPPLCGNPVTLPLLDGPEVDSNPSGSNIGMEITHAHVHTHAHARPDTGPAFVEESSPVLAG